MKRKERKGLSNKFPPYSFLRGKPKTEFTLQPDKKKKKDKKYESSEYSLSLGDRDEIRKTKEARVQGKLYQKGESHT